MQAGLITEREEVDEMPQSRGSGRGAGRMGGSKAAGPDGNCVCPKCGHRVKHVRGEPCYHEQCPKCSTQMTREQEK